MRELFSKEVLLSLRETVSLKDQTARSKKAIYELPNVAVHIGETFNTSPYLVLIYIIITAIDVQHRFGGPIEEDTALFSALVSLALLTVANGLCYVEAHNKYTTGEKITNAGRYVVWRSLKLVGVIITSSIIILFGFMMFIVPGMYFSIRLSLAPPACIIDGFGVRESIRRSVEVTKGQVTLVYTVFSSFGLLVIPTTIVVSTSTGMMEIAAVFVLYGICPPIIQTALAVLYMNGSEDSDLNMYFSDTDEEDDDTEPGSITSGAVSHSASSESD